MQTIVALLALLAVAYATTEREYQTSFINWMKTHQKSYHHDEFPVRYRIFKKNMDVVAENNAKNNGMTLAVNKFADLSSKEFARTYLGMNVKVETPVEVAQVEVGDLPNAWDWNAKGAVSPIKNQGQCGSCWSFSTTGSTEGCHFISTGKMVPLSEKNLMDCSYTQGNQACDGGIMTAAMDYIISNKGIDTEASYPYVPESSTTCNFTTANIGATLSSYTNVQTGSESDLQAKTYKGPVSIAIDASHNSFQLYSSGVYVEPACSSQQLDHGVLSVGWGVDATGGPYWIVKNSWGTEWGLNGFIWMARNKNNQCGVATMATLPSC